MERPRRRRIAALAASLFAGALLLAGSGATAAPTCWDGAGQTVRCESPGALPVGAKLPPEIAANRPADFPMPDGDVLFAAICLLVSIFGTIAIAPSFDGDWDGEG